MIAEDCAKFSGVTENRSITVHVYYPMGTCHDNFHLGMVIRAAWGLMPLLGAVVWNWGEGHREGASKK